MLAGKPSMRKPFDSLCFPITSNRRSVTSTWTPCICNYGLCIFKYLINGLCIFKYLKQRQEKIRLAAGDVIS